MKNTKANTDKYKAYLEATGYDKLPLLKTQPANDNDIMKMLASEGMTLLETEEKPPDTPKTTKSVSGNPYKLAHKKILGELNPEKRSRIEAMELNHNTDNRIYDDFCKQVRILGDNLS